MILSTTTMFFGIKIDLIYKKYISNKKFWYHYKTLFTRQMIEESIFIIAGIN